ncbi:MAG: hypothetical protein ACYDGR_17995 [Candidatus Dormibacteria bacterium]
MIAARNMYPHGTIQEDLAEVADAACEGARLAPNVWSRDLVTIANVSKAKRIRDRARRLDCCLVSDGGGVMVITRPSISALSQSRRRRPWMPGSPSFEKMQAIPYSGSRFQMASGAMRGASG